MSQITRCPSCATAFRVVADQLRISDGWVRCGHCKEVFDATACLQEAPEQPLPPEMPLQSPKASPQPAALPEREVPPRVWGSARNAAVPGDEDPFAEPFLGDGPGPQEGPGSSALLAQDLPEPSLSSFLVAQSATDHAPRQDKATPPDGQDATPQEKRAAPGAAEDDHLTPRGTALDAPQAAVPGGYELPSAPLPDEDAEWLPEDAEPEPGAEPDRASEPDPIAELDPEPESEPEPEPEPDAVPVAAAEDASLPAAATKVPDGAEGPAVLAERQDGAAAGGSAQVPAAAAAFGFSAGRQPASPESRLEEDAEDSGLDAADEPSFVRTARRKAFWRQPVVRAGLTALSLLLVAVLLLQVVLHQRNYLAAAQPQWLPFLKDLCVPLQCRVTPYRHIASVVVDSSSFNKVQGNSYQFALALKNTSDNVLEMPAIELTLTDTQDQPVLRRVLTRQELSAPRTLAARGEWSTVLQIQLAVDGARIAGYRVLAFYP